MSVDFSAPQGVNSKTFKGPAELIAAQNFAVPELFEWCAVNNPQHPLFRYWDGSAIQDIVYSEAVPAIRKAAHLVIDAVNKVEEQARSERPQVVAILAIADSVTYSTLLLGILRAGYTAFPISVRNNAAAVAHLLARTEVRHIYVSSDSGMQALAHEAVKLLDAENGQTIHFHNMPFFEDYYSSGEGDVSADGLPTKFDPEQAAFILHSSGSTALPKPITWTHISASNTMLTAWFGGIDWADMSFGLHGLPLFHMMGVVGLCSAPAVGWIFTVFKPSFPPTIPTDELTFKAIVESKSNAVLCVPSFIEAWSRDPEKVAYMKTLKELLYGGGPLSEDVGASLAAQGIPLHMVYGSTEVGVVNTQIPKDVGRDWNYIEISKHQNPHFIPHGDGTYELVLLKSPYFQPHAVNTQVNGVDGFATNDIVAEHPTRKGWWRVIGRADDLIVFAHGEKTNPGPLEAVLCQSPQVRSAILFGRGRLQIGALLDLKPEYAFDPADTVKLEAFRNRIWPTVERMNSITAQHARLFKEMITVTSPSKPFGYTAKNTPRRHVNTNLYEEEIEALYKAVENSAQENIPAPVTWTTEEALKFVRLAVTSVLGKSISDAEDIFQSGGDSLQATWIRNTILRALREAHPAATHSLPPNLVYEAPSIQALVHKISVALGGDEAAGSLSKTDEMWRMVEKYTTDFPERPSELRSSKPTKDVVFLSGTTGGIGSDILSHLLHDESVALVYAYNRKGADVAERQKKSFRERGLDEADFLSEKFRPIEGEMSEANLGLDSTLYEEIRNSVTHIVHNAWRVDFNLSLASFESNIKATRRLVDLALTSPNPDPARVLFVGSVAVFQNRPESKEPAPEAPIEDPSSAVGSGYGESKWVTETILNIAGERTALRPVNVRVGQVSGNRVGYWTERDWVPAMVKTALYQKCLPDAEGEVTWIPSYDVAAALAQMRNSPYSTLHITHPRPVPWSNLIRPIAEHFGVPLVPYNEWLEVLKSSLQSGEDEVELQRKNPALRLLGFFGHTKFGDEYEPIGLPKISIAKAVEVAPALDIPPLKEEDAKSWVAAWVASGFLPENK